MMYTLLRMTGQLGPLAVAATVIMGATIAVILIYLGVVMRAMLRAEDDATRQFYYKMFCELIKVIRLGRSP